MNVHIGAQDVRQDQGIPRVGLLARDGVPVTVAGGGHWVDREHLTLTGAQHSHEQAAGGLDRHGDRVFLAISVLRERVEQDPVAGRVVGDVPLGE